MPSKKINDDSPDDRPGVDCDDTRRAKTRSERRRYALNLVRAAKFATVLGSVLCFLPIVNLGLFIAALYLANMSDRQESAFNNKFEHFQEGWRNWIYIGLVLFALQNFLVLFRLV